MINTSPLIRTQIHYLLRCANRSPNFPFFNPSTPSKPTTTLPPRKTILVFSTRQPLKIQETVLETKSPFLEVCKNGDNTFSNTAANSRNSARSMILLGATASVLLVIGMMMDEQKALALGPEGPLMEEFWENVRRYGLYALTVSTGALYTIFVPIFELLKNPISAILIILIFGGSFYIISQVLSAMVGVTEFSYDYAY